LKLKKNINNYLEKYKGNIFFQNIAVVASGNITAKLIGILAAPVITRLYTPEDYGVFSIFLSVIGIAGSLATLRYAVTIPIAKDERLADNILKLCFLITISLSLFWVVGIALFGELITDNFSAEQLQPYLWFLPIVFFTKGIYEALNNWAVRIKNFKLITRTKISQGISSAGVKIGLGALGITPLGLFIGQVAQEAAGIGSLSLKLIKLKPTFLKELNWAELKYAANRYKKFPLVQSWSQLLLALGAQLPVLLIGAFYGVEVVGVFGLAQGMINMPMNLIGQSVAQVYYAEISKYGKDNPEKIYKLSISIIKKLFWVGLIPVGIIMAFGPWIFKLVFGPEWIDAGVYSRFLSILILTRFISSPIANIFNVYEKQSLQLTLNIIRVVLVFAAFYASNLFKLSALNSIGVYSILMTVYYAFLTIIILRVVKKNILQ
jgi:O-antigen/teichoic acid export membrane protein